MRIALRWFLDRLLSSEVAGTGLAAWPIPGFYY
jgi:hypothetical protein